jgi:hypothetical protein
LTLLWTGWKWRQDEPYTGKAHRCALYREVHRCTTYRGVCRYVVYRETLRYLPFSVNVPMGLTERYS